jgi:hypothetical protein
MTSEDNIDHFLDLMRDGVAIEDIAQVALFEGFRQGMYTPDLMLLMIEPTIYILLYLADYAGIDKVVLSPDDSDVAQAISTSASGDEEVLEEGILPSEGGSIKVGDKTVTRPESVNPSLLSKITSGKGEEQV